ncbi:MAG: hypothetical protein K6C32_04510 [Bacilli bacterium]|nr:hypothetical protein [Bacilli bacterium]
MDINVIRIRTVLNEKEDQVIKDDNEFLNRINDELIDDDINLIEGVENAPMNIVYVETGGSEPQFLKLFPTLKAPIILLSTCLNNSLPASLEIKTYCANHKTPAFILTGDEKRIAATIKPLARAFMAKSEMENNNLGVVGEPSEWLIASKVTDEDVKKIFHMNLVHISMEEFQSEIDKKEMVKIPHLSALKVKFKDSKVLEGACYIYSALKRLIAKYDLKGLTVRCFDLLSIYKNTACLALALLNEEGITAACEGDVPSLITMHALRALTGRSSFQANPSYISQEKNSVIFAHCTLPLNMTSDYSLTTHFESNLGIGIKGNLRLGDVTICKLFINEKHNISSSIVITGKIKENLSLSNYCRTQINVELNEYDLMQILQEEYGNHLIITYGDVLNDFYSLISLYSFECESKDEVKLHLEQQ